MTPPKRVAAIQPYLFPYVGYFQLMAACDELLLLDDVQYVTRRWINRNRILVNGEPSWITLPVRHACRDLPINERRYAREPLTARRVLHQIEAAYRRAPHLASVLALVDDALTGTDDNVARINARALALVAGAVGIDTPVVLASDTRGNRGLRGEDAIIELCRRRGATAYLNPIGGSGLYDSSRFAAAGLSLEFLQFEAPAYPQFGAPFVPRLSIVDVMMFNALATVRAMITRGSIVAGAARVA